jgi:16S rRNA processing protein RimM
MIAVGRVVRPHGHRGQVVVAPDTDFGEERFRTGETVYVQRHGVVGPLTIVASRPQAGRWIVGFDGIGSIDDAETLRDAELRVHAETLRRLGPGGYYVHDLVGCEVRTIAGRQVGRVSRVELGAGAPMLVVAGRGEVLVPFAEAICRRIDLEARLIEIEPPEGLVDLNRATGRP